MSIITSVTSILGKVGSFIGYFFTAIDIVERVANIFKGSGEVASGEEKHTAAVALIRGAIEQGEFIAQKDIVDEVGFSEGMDLVIQGVVKMLNASFWYKRKV